jgi:Na+-driven multidrug efflux pump
MGATATVAGQNLGAGKPERSIAGVRIASRIGIAVASVVGLSFVVIPDVLLGVFGMRDALVLEIGTALLHYLAVSGFFITVALTYTGALQGTGDTKSPFYISLVSQIGVPFGWLLATQAIRPLVFTDIWLAIVLGHFARCALSVARFRQERWRQIRVDLEPARAN